MTPESRKEIYTLIVTRRVCHLPLIALFFAGALFSWAQQKRSDPKAREGAQVIEQEPPEEDPELKPKTYAFNPFEAVRSITTGDFYFKKGNYHAAASRYLDATKYDPNSARAFMKLGEAYEKERDFKSAREAYTQFIALAKEGTPEAKQVDSVKKKLEKLPARRD